MTVLPMVLIVVGVLLLLALATGLWWQRRGVVAVPAGPRTVADLVSKRAAESALVAAPPDAAVPVVEQPAESAPPSEAPTASEPVAVDESVSDDGQQQDDEQADPVAAPPTPLLVKQATATSTDDAVAPLGEEVPWRRATHLSTAPGTDGPAAAPDAVTDAEPRRVPALALLRQPAPAPGHRDLGPALVAGPGSPPVPTLATAISAVEPTVATPDPAVEDRPHWSTPGRGVDRSELDPEPTSPVDRPAPVAFPAADPDLMFDSPPPAEPPPAEPPPAEPPPAEPSPAEPPVIGPSPTEPPVAEVPVAEVPVPAVVEPPTATAAPDAASPRRDPARVAAEQSAADLALLRTFGSADIGSRPDRAPVVALQGCDRPGPEPARGAAQRVRFRTVRRDGAALPEAAVALLDDRGHESSVGRSDAAGAGELRAPHPGSYVLVATAPDHQPGAVALTVRDGPVDAEVLLVRSASLIGTVTGEDGPIAGARITLVQDGEVVDHAESGADGGYAVADMASGEYALSVTAAGCEPHVTLVAVPDEAELVHDVELAPAGVPAG